jgi:phosphomannomutase
MAVTMSDHGVTFGTSGARGLVKDFSDAYCFTFTRAFLSVLGPDTRQLLVGHDLRPSSPGIAAACMAAAESAGVSCISAGALPTPALALAGQELGLPSIMVTGSHIPADRNGLKAYRAQGEITKADEQAMLAAVVEDPPPRLDRRERAADRSILGRYVARYTQGFGPAALEGLRIGVYEHSTVARDAIHDILRALGAEPVALGRSDSFIPVDTEAVRPEDRALARGWAKEYRFDAIVSADGDADRPLLGDEQGNWLRGDVLGILASLGIHARTVVTPVSSNTALEKTGRFPNVIRTRIGSPFVIAGMERPGNPEPIVGYEANGGFLLGSDVTRQGRRIAALPTRDAMLPVLLVLAMMKAQGVKASGLAAGLPARFTASDRIKDFATESSRALIERLEADHGLLQRLLAPASGEVSAIDRTDGLRVSFGNGDIVHLRPSGNAPELRCYAEADSEARAADLCAGCLERVAKSIATD